MARTVTHAPRVSWAEVEAGFLIRVGIAGAFAALSAPALALSGEMAPLEALGLAIVGALAAAAAGWRTRALLGAPRAPALRLADPAQA